jgi:hypothetical protein
MEIGTQDSTYSKERTFSAGPLVLFVKYAALAYKTLVRARVVHSLSRCQIPIVGHRCILEGDRLSRLNELGDFEWGRDFSSSAGLVPDRGEGQIRTRKLAVTSVAVDGTITRAFSLGLSDWAASVRDSPGRIELLDFEA